MLQVILQCQKNVIVQWLLLGISTLSIYQTCHEWGRPGTLWTQYSNTAKGCEQGRIQDFVRGRAKPSDVRKMVAISAKIINS